MQLVRGFTLVELMVTIAILAIIATLAAPSFSNIIQRQQLNSATESLVSLLEEARTEAVLKHRDISVKISPTDTTQTTYTWKSPNSVPSPTTPSLITFNRYGGTGTNQITATLTYKSQTKVINVTPLGNISSN